LYVLLFIIINQNDYIYCLVLVSVSFVLFCFIFLNMVWNNSDFKKVKDLRGMLTFHHNSDQASFFQQVQNALHKHHIVNLKRDSVFEILLLVGGTKQQEPHFDNPKIYACSRLPGTDGFNQFKKTSYKDLYEVNRQWYNEDVMRENGPASMIFDVTKRECGLKLGVLTQYLTIDGDKASVKHGKLGETFSLVSHEDKYSTIHIPGSGVAFTGDFPHFGVRNVDDSDKGLNTIMNNLFTKLKKIKGDRQDPMTKTKYFNTFQKTNQLDELCRLFVKVKPTNSKFELYDLDIVGTITKKDVDDGTYDFPE
jgi:hypothetical protein